MRDSTEVAGLLVLGEARRLGGLTILAESTRDPRKIFIRVTPQKKVTRTRRRKIVDKSRLNQ